MPEKVHERLLKDLGDILVSKKRPIEYDNRIYWGTEPITHIKITDI